MGISYQYCSNCFTPFPSGTRYCANCGQAVDPVLVAELQWLFRSLKDLDARIAAGQGDTTITQLRDEYREEYLTQRQGEVGERPATAPQEPVSAPVWPTTPQPPATPAPSPAGGALGTPPPVTSTPEPRPIFSWREFVQEQAIAIMAYLGGFLLLVATLSFEVGAWQFLTNGVKLLVVSAVYVVFGVLGFAMRQAERLRTVGRAYLGVFALMTPLVCLAVYRFALQPLHFSGPAMLSLSSFYATVVYLALAWRTRFATYSYLGWAALLVGALAVIPWQALSWDWWTFTVALMALIMLIPRQFRRFEAAALIADSGAQLAGVATAAAVVGVEFQGMAIWGAAISPTASGVGPLRSAFALAACMLPVLAVVWGLTLRRLGWQVERAYFDIADWFVAAFGAQAAVAVAAWAHADRATLTYLLAALAATQIAVMAGLKWLATRRGGLRFGIGGLGLGLAIIGIFVNIAAPLPDWPLVAALSAAGLVALSLATLERQPAFIVVGGTFFSLAYHTAIVTFYPDFPPYPRSGLPYPNPEEALYEAGFALGIWLVALGIGLRQSWRPYAGGAYLVAFGNALYAAFLILFYPGHDVTTQTVVLVAFVAAALVAGLREQAPEPGGIAFGLFGLLAVIPTTIRAENGLTIGATTIIVWLLTIGIRRIIGRTWMIAAYVVALWTTALASLHLIIAPPATTAGWSLFGVPFVAWLLLASAIPATIAALEENAEPLTIFPALMALGAVLATADHVAPAVLVFALIAVAVILRRLRGATWSVAWYASAVLASIFAVNTLGGLGNNGPYWQTIFTLALAAAAYAVAAFERQWLVSLAAFPYLIAALSLLPASNDFVPTLIITFGTVALGIALRLVPVRLRVEWSLGLYSSAVAGSIFAIARVTPFDAAHVEAWLLIFAAVAYIAAIIERQPLAGIAPAVYATGAVVAQPDGHALLPLSLSLAVLGVLAGRLGGWSVAGGWRWSWPLYAASAIAAAATVGQSQGDLIFASQALAIIAVAAYLVAALEARPDVLVGALVVGAAALGETAVALRWPAWQGVLAFAALSWGYMLLHWVWRVLPWLRPRGGAWWAAFAGGLAPPGGPVPAQPSGNSVGAARLDDPRAIGVAVHRIGSLLLALGTVVAAMSGTDTFKPFNVATETVVVALASFAALLALQAMLSLRWHVLWYLAGGAVALAISWQTRWFGADNVQAYILAPGSYQLIIGALLPVDRRLGQPNWCGGSAATGQLFSLTGALTLMVPTLTQSFQPDQDWIYAIILAGEALLIAGVGVGTRSRVLVAAGLSFVGLAAIRGSVLAVNSGVPIAVVIGVIALLLMGAATWLSLRLRRETTP